MFRAVWEQVKVKKIMSEQSKTRLIGPQLPWHHQAWGVQNRHHAGVLDHCFTNTVCEACTVHR